MDTRYLTTFQTIIREGSFTRAAEKLNYTPSAITFHVAQLEQELAVPLFEKVGRRRVLSKAGERLVPFVEEILGSMERLRSFEGDLAKEPGELTVGIAETQLCYRLPGALSELHRRAPRARLRIRSMNCYDIRDALLDGTLDLGVFYADVGGFGSALATHPLGRFPVALVAAPATAREFHDFTTPDRQIPIPFLINEQNCIFRQMFEDYLKQRSVRLDQTIELWSIPTIIHLVCGGLGVSFLPRFAVQEELDRGTLVEIPTGLQDRAISAVCAHHKNKQLTPLMREFVQLCAGRGQGQAKAGRKERMTQG